MAKQPTELAFWRTFISDLFLGTLKRLSLFPFLGVLIGLLAFYILNYPLIGRTGLFSPIKWLIVLLSLLWFPLLGFFRFLLVWLQYGFFKRFKKFCQRKAGISLCRRLFVS